MPKNAIPFDEYTANRVDRAPELYIEEFVQDAGEPSFGTQNAYDPMRRDSKYPPAPATSPGGENLGS